jgi:two-component system CitB family response regulator
MSVLRVLIVEDDFRVAQVNRSFVDQVEGFVVVGMAATAQEAERAVAELQPDLILLDLYLPDGSGLELLRRLRSGGDPADVIVITAAKEATALQAALRGGVVDYILKPYRFERFAEALRQYRDRRTQMARAAQVEQSQVDRLLGRRPTTSGNLLPKGIDPLTLNRVLAALSQETKPLTADEFGARTGLSRTTARRYLEYLVEVGKATVQPSYGDVGRPERLYRGA